MARTLLKNVLLDGQSTSVVIAGNRYEQIGGEICGEFAQVIDGKSRLALLPAFYNTHSHLPMTLLRGYADDLELFSWLNDHIWPAEARLTDEDIYWGTRLALLEMLKTGSVFVNDMYWKAAETYRAVSEMGLRAAISYFHLSPQGGLDQDANLQGVTNLRDFAAKFPCDRIMLTRGPHAVYTVSDQAFREIAEFVRQEGCYLHIHASETRKEVEDCRAQHGGLTPIAHLHKFGLLGPKTVLAHCVHLTDEDIQLLAETQTIIATCPVSNMKLCSGMFRWRDAQAAGCRITIGTDGCASNNNLSMLDEMKFAALSAKIQADDPTAASAAEVWTAATVAGARAFGLDAGEIAVGQLADGMLVNTDSPLMVGDYNLISNLVYSADSSLIDTVICDGRVLMTGHHVDGEEEILDKCRQICRRLETARQQNK
ncbi:MAG: amidohydrolase [Victivallales bacterium]|nr:amidohydrolase [Victivallales bacterium]